MRLMLALLLLVPLSVSAQEPAAAEIRRPTEEVHRLKIENLQMRTALLQQQVAQLQREVEQAGKQIEADWTALEALLRTALTPPADWVLDRARGGFVPKPKEPTR